MARIEPLIPFILYYEAGVRPGASWDEVLRRGYSDHPLDRGGATMAGVTLATFRAFRPGADKSALRRITRAEWLQIVKGMYWDRWQADKIVSDPLAWILVDWVWASGVHGIKRPQRLLGVQPDGKVGPKTLAALNAAAPRDLFEAVKQDRRRFIDGIIRANPSQGRWRRGWLRRLEAITFNGLRYE